MSSLLAVSRARVRVADAVQQQRTRLSLVRGSGSRGPRIPFAAVVLTVLGAGLVGLLLLNTSLQQGAFQASKLEERATALAHRQEALELRVAKLRRSERVAELAASMGMVPHDNPAFLRLSDKKVLGRPTPASGSSRLQSLTSVPAPGHGSRP